MWWLYNRKWRNFWGKRINMADAILDRSCSPPCPRYVHSLITRIIAANAIQALHTVPALLPASTAISAVASIDARASAVAADGPVWTLPPTAAAVVLIVLKQVHTPSIATSGLLVFLLTISCLASTLEIGTAGRPIRLFSQEVTRIVRVLRRVFMMRILSQEPAIRTRPVHSQAFFFYHRHSKSYLLQAKRNR